MKRGGWRGDAGIGIPRAAIFRHTMRCKEGAASRLLLSTGRENLPHALLAQKMIA